MPSATSETPMRSRKASASILVVGCFATKLAIDAGHFRRDVDPKLFAVQLLGIMLSTHQMKRLLHDPSYAKLMWRSVDNLFDSARPTKHRT